MLIFDSRYSGYGKQKPKQWGSLSAVRSAIFRNAEAMGIDPSAIKGYWPLWEGASSITRNIIIDYESVMFALTWEKTGISTDVSSTLYAAPDGLFGVSDGVTIITKLNQSLVDGDSFPRIVQRANADGNGFSLRFYYGDRDGVLLFQDRASSDDNTTTDWSLIRGKKYTIVGTSDRTSTRNLFVDGYKHSDTISDAAGDGGGTAVEFFTRVNANTYHFHGGVDQVVILSTFVDDSIAEALSTANYLLLQPNPTPLIFDWGASAASGWQHQIFGVTPTTVNGLSAADIAKIEGV